MIQNYEARINALKNIQEAIDDLSGIVMITQPIKLSMVYLKKTRESIIREMNEA